MEHSRRASTPKFFALLALLLVTAISACAEQPFAFASTPGKLPKNIVPRHYSIQLQPNLETFLTHGKVTVDFEVLHSAKEITLNALDLDITKATLLATPNVELKPRPNPERQTVSFKLPRALSPGKYQLKLEFTGHLTAQAQGLFYVRYTAPSGKKILLATQMEPTDARRMFPCWDEPVFRASFGLTVVLPEKFKAVSNMPIARESSLADGLKETTFADTPAMASYLVVLVAGELEAIRDEMDGTQIRVITTEGKQEQGRYALAATKKLLAYYNDYFGIKYPLPKLDQIAIPGGFDGAMENWGAITYNESVLLFDPKTSSLQTQRDVFVDVAHEMAHQWFGNLVTTAWWNNLWLNEGFASWMETKATDHFNPDWQMWLTAASDISAVMSGDAHRTTHPIQEQVDSESEANDAFDSITYQKGEALLRMLEAYLGPDEFRRGIHQYLSEHLYSSATTADLWNALQKVSGKPIRAISAGWTEQPGLPVVKVTAKCANREETVRLEQERFTVQFPHAPSLRWQIPIAIAAYPGITNEILLDRKSAALTIVRCRSFLKANAGDTGYYRVQYSPPLRAALQQNINSLPAIDRLNLLNDSWALVEGDRASSADYFALVGALHDEHTYAIWDQILSTLYLIDDLEQEQAGYSNFQKFARTLLRPPLEPLGWDPQPSEPVNTALLRGKLIAALGHFGDDAMIREAKSRFAQFVAAPDSLPASLRPAVLRIAGRYADRSIYDQIHDLARNATGSEARQLYYSAMTAARDPELAKATLAVSLTDETVPQETTELVVQVASNGEQKELAWNFALQHLRELLPKVDSFNRNNYLPSIMSSFSDTARADELQSSVKKYISADALAKAREAAEEIRFKAMLKKRELPLLDRWLANR